MGFLFDLLDNPYVPWVVGLVRPVPRLPLPRGPPAPPRARRRPAGEDLVSRVLGPRFAEKKLEREVARLKKQDNYLAAGKLLEDVGPAGRGGRGLPRGPGVLGGGVHLREARAARSARPSSTSRPATTRRGRPSSPSAGKPARAAALFLEKGNNLEAARLFALAGQWGTAAELYEKSGYPLRAAEAWEKDGKPLKAAEAYEKHFMENVSFSTTYSSTAPATEQQERAPGGPALREGRPARPGGRRLLEGRLPPAGGRGAPAPRAAGARRPSSSCARRTTRRPRSRSSRRATPCGPRPCGASRPSRPTARPRPRPGS